MIQQNDTVTFGLDGFGAVFSIDCNVEFGMDIVADVDELLDYSLTETVHEKRQSITITGVFINRATALLMADWLWKENKQLTIDSTVFDVVNDGGNHRSVFKHFKNSNQRVEIKLKFYTKSWVSM